MKHSIRSLVLSICLLFLGTTGAYAADPSSTTNLKVGVLDWQQLLTKAPQAEAASKRLEDEFQKRKNSLIAKQKDFQSKQEKLQRDRDVMSDSERSKSEKELTKLQQDLRHLDEELRADYTSRHKEEMDEFVSTVRDVVAKLAAEEKYDLVLPQEATLFIAERIDVTENVLKRMEKIKGSSKSSSSSKEKDKEKK